MKKIFKINLLSALFAIIFMSCSRNGSGSGSEGGAATGGYYIKMSVDGNSKSGVANTSYLRPYTATVGGVQQNRKHLMVAAGGFSGTATETINLSMTNFIGKGSYSLAADNAETTAQYAKVASDPNQVYGKESGMIVITEYDTKTVKGTFEFIGKTNAGATVDITKGEFYLPVTEN